MFFKIYWKTAGKMISTAVFVSFMAIVLQGCSYMGIRSIPASELEAKYTNSESKFVVVDGTRVHYRDEGNGEPLILLHGIFASLHTWDGWAERLKTKYRVIRLDLPPFGLTGPPSFAFKKEEYLKFINGFTDALGIKKYHLAGNSLGGYFAWNIALSYPDKVDRLILVDAAAYPQEPPFPIKAFTMPLFGNVPTRITPRFIVGYNVRSTYGEPDLVKDETIERYHELTLREGNRDAIKDLFEYVQEMKNNMPLEISEIRQPTLIMWGGRDVWIPTEEMVRNWRRDLPSAEFIIYEKAGHIPMEEMPDETARDADSFLSGRMDSDSIKAGL